MTNKKPNGAYLTKYVSLDPVVSVFLYAIFIFGYCSNAYLLINNLNDTVTVRIILRILGVFFPFLGAIMGYV